MHSLIIHSCAMACPGWVGKVKAPRTREIRSSCHWLLSRFWERFLKCRLGLHRVSVSRISSCDLHFKFIFLLGEYPVTTKFSPNLRCEVYPFVPRPKFIRTRSCILNTTRCVLFHFELIRLCRVWLWLGRIPFELLPQMQRCYTSLET